MADEPMPSFVDFDGELCGGRYLPWPFVYPGPFRGTAAARIDL
jgi:hypothetical protein